MAAAIRLLHAEDNQAEAELIGYEIRRGGVQYEYRRVQTEVDFRREIAQFKPDVIISDYTMPQFSGLEALIIAREQSPDTPFIFVSGTIREDYAVEALKAGAADYVLKDNLTRLVPAINRALRDAELRGAHRTAELERARLEQALREREARLRRAQAVAGLAHVVSGPDGRFESWSDSLPLLIGTEVDGMPLDTRAWLDLVHPDDRQQFRAAAIEAVKRGERREVEYRARRSDGTWINIRQIMEPAEEGAVPMTGSLWFSTIQDVTLQRRSEERIRRMNRVYAVLSGINTLIVRVRDRGELFQEACRIAVEEGHFALAWIGLVDREAMQLKLMASHDTTQGYVDLLPLGLDRSAPGGFGLAGRAVWERRAMIANDIATGTQLNLLTEEALARGFRSLVALPLMLNDEVIGVLSLYADTPGYFDDDEMKLLLELAGDIAFALDHLEKADRLEYLAYHDPLTGLANRRLFEDRLGQFIGEAVREERKLAVLMIDVVRFKTINDTFGRSAGDGLLKELAERAALHSGDRSGLARLGSDHFGFVIPGAESADEVGRRLKTMQQAVLDRPFTIGGADLRIGAKIGIVICPDDGTDADTLLKNAEVALKRAKASAEPYLFFNDKMTERVAEKLMLENRLRQALEKEEFVLHYQPKLDLDSGQVIGVEALIRWQNPDGGLVPPMQFVPLLEETGLILEVGTWALRQAVTDHGRLAGLGLAPLRIAVNVSPMQLRRADFVDILRTTIAEGASPTGIDLEITESVVMEDVADNIRKLKEVNAMGVHIAIDDFGTGYSSLAYLAKLPVQTLKIDRSFVITMLQEPATMTLVSTMISLAHSLRLKVVAEGVDADEQAKMLRLLRCDQIQGYLFSKPLPLDALAALLKQHQQA